MKVIVLLNDAAGMPAQPAAENHPGRIHQALKRAGIDAAVRPTRGSDLARATAAAADEDVDAVIAAGGDGSVSAVAGALAGSGRVMGVIPLGTLNHFARDLGIPMQLEGAARIIADGHVRQVDAGQINDRVFINNASIGLYPHLVRERERRAQQLGRGNWLAMLQAVLVIVRRFPQVRVRLGIADRTLVRTTPFVFVGNNRYEVNLLRLGERLRLDGGELSLYLTRRSGRLALMRLMMGVLLHRLEQNQDFEMLPLQEFWIESGRSSLSVAIDGEVDRLHPPLHFRVRPGALRVLAPPAAVPATQ